MQGQILGNRYYIKEQLAKQTGRRTFVAEDSKTGETVVIKLLLFNPDFEWSDLKLFEREAETLKYLDCRSVPKYLDYFEVNTEQYQGFALVQTYIEAKSLKQQLEEGRKFTKDELEELAKSLLGILVYLHSLNPPIVHRDIKPSNILLKDRSGNSIGNVYLIDFGSVQNVALQEQATLTIVGTYGYMPPEQFGGRTVPASDLYSLGATLIYIATGINPADLPQKDGKIKFEDLVSLPLPFVRWLSGLIEPSLDRRFSSAREALDALINIYRTEAIEPIQVGIEKPAGSRVKIEKTAEKIEIILPPEGFTPKILFLGAFAIGWNSFLVAWTGGALFIPSPIAIFFLLFSLPFWVVGAGLIGSILYCLGGWASLVIDDDIYFKHRIFGLSLPIRNKMPRESIDKIEYTSSYQTRDSDGDRITVPDSVSIWAGTREYKFYTQFKEYLTKPELEWLASELSDWLGIPIQRKK